MLLVALEGTFFYNLHKFNFIDSTDTRKHHNIHVHFMNAFIEKYKIYMLAIYYKLNFDFDFVFRILCDITNDFFFILFFFSR